MHPLRSQIGNHATLAEFFIALPILGISSGVAGIVQILLVFEFGDDGFDQQCAIVSFRSARTQQALQLGYGAHLSGQRGHSVVIQFHIAELAPRLGAGERHAPRLSGFGNWLSALSYRLSAKAKGKKKPSRITQKPRSSQTKEQISQIETAFFVYIL